jgi:hypothetical protein
MTPERTAKQKARIAAVATEIEALADPAKQGEVAFDQFESLLGELHKLGFFPETSAVARWRARSCDCGNAADADSDAPSSALEGACRKG